MGHALFNKGIRTSDRARNMDNKIYSGNEGAIEISRYRNRY